MKILFCFLLIILCLLYVLKIKENYVNKVGGIIPFEVSEDIFLPIINTPLSEIKSKFLKNPEQRIPNFFCYNFGVLSPVQNQGNVCGSCWSFVVSGLLSDKIRIFKNSKTILSAQQLLYCYDYPNGCNGENPEDVLIWLDKTKTILYDNILIPYVQEKQLNIDNNCNIKDVFKNGFNIKENSIHSIVSKNIEENVKNMKLELILHGPFFSTIEVYEDFLFFVETEPYINNKKSSFIGGHGVVIVGYCEPNVDLRKGYVDGYWICRNSWGLSWPKGSPASPGYFTISMGKNICGIESRCASGMIDMDDYSYVSDNVAYTTFIKYIADVLA